MIDSKFIKKRYGPVKYVVGLEKIKEYAIATGDTNPLYLDEEAAKAGPNGGIVAPPMFAVVYTKDVMEQMLFDKELALNLAMLVHGEQQFDFYEPARPGDAVISEAQIFNIERKEDKDFVSVEVKSSVNHRPITRAVFTFLIRD